MNGWVISFLSDSAQIEPQNNRDEYDSLSWSPYDRICFKDFDNFDALCSYSVAINSEQRHWFGAEKIIHLYFDNSYFEKNGYTLWDLNSKDEKNNNNRIINNDYDYYCVLALRYNTTILDLKNDPKNIKYEQKIRYAVYDKIYTFIKENNLTCDYRAFQTLSVEDIVLIVCANDLRTIYDYIEFVKSIEVNNESLFYSLSVFSGLNNMITEKTPKMDALVKLNLRIDNNNSTKNILDCLMKKMGDIDTKLPNNARFELRNNGIFVHIPYMTDEDYLLPILSLYEKEGVFNGTSDFYKTYIKSSRTYWIVSEESDEILYESTDTNIVLTLPHPSNCEDELESKSIIDGNKNAIAHFIVNEYDRLIGTQRFTAWKPILKEQQNIFIQLYNNYNITSSNESLCDLINCTQNALMFINQACSPIYEIPYHNNHYYSSNNDLLKMYYGIISSLLKIGYSLCHNDNTKQHPIHFAVNFESTPRIYSKMFMIKRKISKDTSFDERFVIFFLPSDSLHRYPEMIPSLIHEVFHYIAPYDRKIRAEYILRAIIRKIFLIVIVESFLGFEDLVPDQKYYIQSYYLNSRIIDDVFNDVRQFIFNQNSKFFEKTISELADDYFSRFVDFELVYQEIYFSITRWMDTHRNIINELDQKAKSKKPQWRSLVLKKDLCKQIQSELKSPKCKEELNRCFSSSIPINKSNYVNLIQDFVSDIVTNAKEIFCDVFILRILDMDFSDYIVIFFNNLLKKSDLEELRKVLELEDDNKINLISSDLRLLIIIEYLFKKEGLDENKRGDWLKEQLKKSEGTITEENKAIFRVFSQYIEFCYIQNYSYNTMFISVLEKIACIDDYESFPYNNEEIYEIIQILRDSYNTDISVSIEYKNINYFTYYSNKYIINNHNSCPDKSPISSHIDIANPFHNVVASTGEYIDVVNKIVRSIGNFDSCRPWFRGVCNANFSLTPSLFRKIDKRLSLYSNQARIIKYSYERSLSFNSLWSMSIVDQMSFLQHYGISTNLLDFTFNMLVALHFALNPDQPFDREAVTKGDTQAVVYIFDPIEYSKATTYLHDGLLTDVKYDFISPIVYNFDEPLLKQYFVNDMTSEKMISHNNQYNKLYSPSPRTDLFPRPIIVQHTNERIHAQSGSFLAFSLNSSPDCNKMANNPYDYLSLFNIQKQYYDLLSSLGRKNEGTFIHKIYIDRNAVHVIRKELKTMNITEGHYYPEYSTIVRETMNDYQKFLDSTSSSACS